MTWQITRMPAFSVLGFAIRTTNTREMSGEGGIGPLWQRYMQAGSDAIPGVSDTSLTFSVYTNYESDHDGAYDVILGRPVSVLPPGRDDLRGVAIAAGDYAVFPVTSATADGIQAAWMNVYEYFDEQRALQRSFTADFERYSPEGIQLYIAILRK